MKKRFLTFLYVLLLPSLVLAMGSPVTMLQTISNDMIVALDKNKTAIKNDPHVVFDLTEKILIPHVDVAAMSRLALGRQHWLAASGEQREEFKQAFMNLMIRTYATALTAYTDEKIQFQPLRVDPAKEKRVQVNSLIIQRGGPSIPVSYRLFQRNGVWKVYDMTVDGVSMVQSFHSQFANEIARGGMDGLLSAMRQHAAAVDKKSRS